jgi:hypothetical protein
VRKVGRGVESDYEVSAGFFNAMNPDTDEKISRWLFGLIDAGGIVVKTPVANGAALIQIWL